MRLSLRTKQVAGITLIVGLAVIASSLVYLAAITRFSLEESAVRGELLARTIFQQASRVAGQADAHEALKADPGVRATLEAAIAYAPNVTYAAIVDVAGSAIVHSSPALEGMPVAGQPLLRDLLAEGPLRQVRAIYSDRTFEVRERLLVQDGGTFGEIRVGSSMVLVRQGLARALWPALLTTLAAMALALALASTFARWLLRPIAMLETGLARLGRGEVGVKLELPPDEVFGELGRSFDHVSATLAEVRSQLASQPESLESIVDRLEDAVAVFGPSGELMFANAPIRPALLPVAGAAAGGAGFAEGHPYREVLTRALQQKATVGPETVAVQGDGAAAADHIVTAHALAGRDGRFLGVMLVARNLADRTHVQSTLRYSQKLASLNRLLAGVAHEVKNPLNAMTIHLELLRQKLGEVSFPPVATDLAGGLRHAAIIDQEIRRLDEVVQGFLRFSRPEDLALEPVPMAALVDDVFALVKAGASAGAIELRNACRPDLPSVQGDPVLLRQALLNLSLNACQAMPDGGMLTIKGRERSGDVVEIEVEDSGIGIPPEHLPRVFDLYFTTREAGSGLGLSMVYRTVQLHDGSIEVESTVGRGTTFTLRLPAVRPAG